MLMQKLTFRIAATAILAITATPQVPSTEPHAATTPLVVPAEEAALLEYDAGRLRVLVSAESTGGRYSVMELNELPGYRTPPHMHPGMDETFYVVEGTLELRLRGKTYRLGAGSYAHVPRDTPHAQGSADDKPVRVLVTVSPGQFQEFFLDRVALTAKTPRGHPDFQSSYLEIIRKHSRWLRPASLEFSTTE